MKPLQIGLMVVAGAIGGALVMKVVQRPQAPAVAEVQNPPAPAPPVEPAVPPPQAVPPAPAEYAAPVERREAPKPQRVPRHYRQTGTVAKSDPAPPVIVPAPPVSAPAQPEPVKDPPPPPPQPIAPAPAEPEHATPVPPPPPEPRKVTLNAGTLIPVRLVDGLSSERNVPGDTFTATLDKELVVDGFVIAERGARVQGRVVASDRGGKVSGVASLAVEVTRIHLSDGQTVALQTDRFERHAVNTHREDATKVGTGAAVGAIIGAIAGGGKGAAIGAGVGGGAGAGDVLLTRGKPATLPSETRLNFRLRAPVTITEKGS